MEKESTSGEEKKWTHVSIEMNKWKYNRVNLYTNNPLSFPPAKIYSSIYHQPESRQFSHSLIILWQSFILEFHFASWQYFFFSTESEKFFAVQDFWNFWWELIFAIFFSSNRTSTRNKTWHFKNFLPVKLKQTWLQTPDSLK